MQVAYLRRFERDWASTDYLKRSFTNRRAYLAWLVNDQNTAGEDETETQQNDENRAGPSGTQHTDNNNGANDSDTDSLAHEDDEDDFMTNIDDDVDFGNY